MVIVLSTAVFLSACDTSKQPNPPKPEKHLVNRPPTRPINSIRVASFKCDNEVTGQAVRNVFMEMLARYGDVKVVLEGEADVIIEGTVTVALMDSSSSKGERVATTYISGVTALAMRDGGVLASSSWGQVLEKKSPSIPPEKIAREAADRLLGQLAREGLKRR